MHIFYVFMTHLLLFFFWYSMLCDWFMSFFKLLQIFPPNFQYIYWKKSANKWIHEVDFIFLGSKITADGGCSHEIKRRLFLGRKVMTNLDSILKIRDITLPTKVCLVKAIIFPLVMYGCESWTIKKPEHWRIDAFELQC